MSDRTKARAEILRRQALVHLLTQLADAGVIRIVICTRFPGYHVRAAIGDAQRGIPVHYSHETGSLDTEKVYKRPSPVTPPIFFCG